MLNDVVNNVFVTELIIKRTLGGTPLASSRKLQRKVRGSFNASHGRQSKVARSPSQLKYTSDRNRCKTHWI